MPLLDEGTEISQPMKNTIRARTSGVLAHPYRLRVVDWAAGSSTIVSRCLAARETAERRLVRLCRTKSMIQLPIPGELLRLFLLRGMACTGLRWGVAFSSLQAVLSPAQITRT